MNGFESHINAAIVPREIIMSASQEDLLSLVKLRKLKRTHEGQVMIDKSPYLAIKDSDIRLIQPSSEEAKGHKIKLLLC